MVLNIFLDNERRGSIGYDLEEDYLNSIARRQSIIQSVEHIAPSIPGYIVGCIVLSTVCSALLLPFFTMVKSSSSYLFTAWRAQINILFFVPFFIRELLKYKEGVRKLFSLKNVLTILLCQVFGVMQTFCQLIAMSHTFSSHVLLFSNMTSVVFIFWKIVKRFAGLFSLK